MADTANPEVNTTLLVSANFEKKFLNIVLIPGSTKATVPGTSYDQLRYAYSFGGGKLAQKVLNSLLDTKTENYIVVGQPLLANLIEAVDGLPLTMADEITTYVNYRYTIFPAGKQTLTGIQTIDLLSYFAQKKDIQETLENELIVLDSLITTIWKSNDFNKDKNIKLDEEALAGLEYNLEEEELQELKDFLFELKPKEISLVYLNGAQENGENGTPYWLPDHKQIAKILTTLEKGNILKSASLGGEITVSKETITRGAASSSGEIIVNEELPLVSVDVLNGNGVEDSAEEVAALLREAGYVIGRVGNASRQNYPVSYILYQEGFSQKAEEVATLLSIIQLGPMPEHLETDSEIAVVVGLDKIVTPEKGTQEETQPGP